MLLGLCRTLQRPANVRRRYSEDRALRTLRFMRENVGRNWRNLLPAQQ